METKSGSSSQKHYLMEEFDAKLFCDTYHHLDSHNELYDELTLLPLSLLHKALHSGRITGHSLIDLSIGPNVGQLTSISEFFNDITMLELNDDCIKELEKWLNTHDSAYDWSHIFKYISEIDGKGEEWKTIEERVKRSIKRILKCDFTKENPTDPVTLHKVDCLLVCCSLEVMCHDQDEYFSCLKKISRWLKPGGHLILLVVLKAKFLSIGEHRFHILTLEEEFIKKTLRDIGYVIENIEVVERKSNHEAVSYDHMALITAIMQ